MKVINHIVAIDEMWLRSYEPELKPQFSEWHTLDSPRPAKFRNLKQFEVIAYDNRRILSTDFFIIREIVNGTYYAEFLRMKLRPST